MGDRSHIVHHGYQYGTDQSLPLERIVYPIDWFHVAIRTFLIGVTAATAAYAMGWIS